MVRFKMPSRPRWNYGGLLSDALENRPVVGINLPASDEVLVSQDGETITRDEIYRLLSEDKIEAAYWKEDGSVEIGGTVYRPRED